MDELQVSARFPDIKRDNLDEFKKLAAEMLEITKGEPGTLQYDYFLNSDETVCMVRETYASSDAHMAHVANMGDRLPRLGELGSGLVDAEVFGSPSPAHSEFFADFNPTVYSYFQGL